MANASCALARLALRALPNDVNPAERNDVLETFAAVSTEQSQTLPWGRLLVDSLLELASLARYVWGAWTADLIPEIKGTDRMRIMMNDVSQALKSLARRPGYSAIAVLIMSVGIGAGTAIFSVLDPVLLRADSFDEEKTLVYLHQKLKHADLSFNHHSAEGLDLYRTASTLEGVAGYTTDTTAMFDGSEPERVNSSEIDEGLLPLLRTSPILGRNFTASDRGLALVLIHEGLWRERFGSSFEVLGRSIELDGIAHEIVGVLPAEFTFPDAQTRVWTPRQEPEEGWSKLSSSVVVRPAPGTPLDTATEQLSQLAARVKDESFPVSGEISPRLHTKDGTDQNTKTSLWLLLGAVGILLLTACANAANLALTHTTGRQGELAIRRALGASRKRLIRQLLTESVMLSLAAGIVGFGLAQLAISPLLRLAPESVRLPAEKLVTFDWRILVFAVLVSGLVAALTGIFPALRATLAVWTSQHRVVGARNTRRTGTILATAQTTMAFVLLLAAGLLLRSFDRLVGVEPGFDATNIMAIDLNLETAQYRDQANVRAYYEGVLEQLEQLPFVTEATTATGIPPQISIRIGLALQAEGEEPLSDTPSMSLPSVTADPNYFSVMKIPLLAGAPFNADSADQQLVLSESFAIRLFSDQDPIGKRIRLGAEEPWLTVTGVAAEVQQSGPRHNLLDEGEVYFPFNPEHAARRTLLVKTEGDPFDRLDDIKAALWHVDERVPLHRIRSLEGEWAATMAKPRFLLEIIGILAVLTLMLTLAGMYSVLSYSVAKRTREIGVRMALGAQAKSVLWLVMRQGLIASVIGISAGLMIGRFGADLLQQQLFEISAFDPAAIVVTTAVTLVVVLLAAWVPASRATRVHPAATLRGE